MFVCVYPHSGLFICRWLRNLTCETVPNNFSVIKMFRFAGYQLYCYSQPISHALNRNQSPNIHFWHVFKEITNYTTFISSQSLNLGGRRCTTGDVATIPFHPSLSSAALRESPNPIPVFSSKVPGAHLSFLPWCPQSLCQATSDPIWIFYHLLLSLLMCLGHIFSLAVPTPLQTAGLCRVTFS